MVMKMKCSSTFIIILSYGFRRLLPGRAHAVAEEQDLLVQGIPMGQPGARSADLTPLLDEPHGLSLLLLSMVVIMIAIVSVVITFTILTRIANQAIATSFAA